MLKLFSRTIFCFCKFKYYKDLAQQLNYVLPKINQELGYTQNQKCWLIGYRLINNLQSIQNTITITSSSQKNTDQNQHEEQDKKQAIKLQPDPQSRELLSYSDIQKYANNNDMDICTTNPDQKQVTLVKLRQQIYRKYYYENIFRARSPAKKYKQIRLPQKIQEHDILTKVQNIRSLIKKGDFKFKIYCQNCSKESKKKIMKLCQFLGRKPEVQVQQYQLKQKSRTRPKVVIQRWNATLDFSKQSKVDYDKVNRKWKRHLILQKVNAKKKEQQANKQEEGFKNVQNLQVSLQRQIARQLIKMKAPLPTHLKGYGDLQDSIRKDGKNFFMKFVKSSIPDKDSEQNEEADEQQENQDEESEVKQNKMNKLKLTRSVEQIIQEMDKIKEKKQQIQAFDTYKLKNLQKQLKQALYLAGFKQKK